VEDGSKLVKAAIAAVISTGLTAWAGQAPNPLNDKTPAQSETQALIKTGQQLFQQNCAFCHGRDAGGGETGPDLTGSTLVANDAHGDKITQVVRQGRPAKGMPAFNLPDPDMRAIVEFIHYRRDYSEAHPGSRRRVDVSDLQTGDVAAGKRYFEGPGGCTSCHSATGDLAKVARRLVGLRLEERMLYPQDAKATVTVTLPSGKTLTGDLRYRDEFMIGLVDQDGWYHSWPVTAIKYKVEEPAQAHAELLGKYTDEDIHNLMAYLQTLK
jgi:cytochrome c oxidase cbb3-type subunit 3